VYNEEFEFPDYDKKATGGSIGFGKELSEYVRGNITYRLEDVEITNIEEGASSIVKDQEGQRITSSISPSLWRDTRDNHLDPTRGSKNIWIQREVQKTLSIQQLPALEEIIIS
jgi:outer membrane protein insertion porin family